MKRVWKSLDTNEGRMYEVLLLFPGHADWTRHELVIAKSPSHAAEIIAQMYAGSKLWVIEPDFIGRDLNVLQMEEGQ